MDFLAAVKQKLQELEEQARLMEAPTQGAARPLRGLKKAEQRAQKSPRFTSSEDFQTPACPTEGMSQPSDHPLPPVGRQRLVEDLHGRLDEAFLLSEILGPPRCLRGWDE